MPGREQCQFTKVVSWPCGSKLRTVRLGGLDQILSSRQIACNHMPVLTGLEHGWHSKGLGLSSVLDGRSFAFDQEEELMTCHQIIQNLQNFVLHPCLSHIYHTFSDSDHLKSQHFQVPSSPSWMTKSPDP